MKKPNKKKRAASQIHPEYYGKDAYRSDLPGAAAFEPPSQELVERFIRKEARETALFGLPPERKGSPLWRAGVPEESGNTYTWNHERINIAAVPHFWTGIPGMSWL